MRFYRSMKIILGKTFLLIIVQAITFSLLNAYYILLRPLLMESLFSALNSGNLKDTADVCAFYGILIFCGVLVSYVNDVILDSNLFKALYTTVGNILVKWNKSRFIKGEAGGEVFQTATSGAKSIISAPLQLINFSLIIGTFIYLLYFTAEIVESLPYILMMLFVIMLAVNTWEFRRINGQTEKQQDKSAKAESEYLRYLNTMHVLHSHRYADNEENLYLECRDDEKKAQIEISETELRCELLLNITIATGFVLLFLSVLYSENRLMIAAGIAASVALLESLSQNVIKLIESVQGISGVVIPIRRLKKFMSGLADSEKCTSPMNIDFDQPALVLKNGKTSMEFHAGEKVAIIGRNGSGKTTLLNRISGVSEKISSEKEIDVLVFGRSPEDLSYEERRRVFSVLPKDSSMYEATVMENICMNCDDAEEAVAIDMTEKLGITNISEQNALTLSGGQSRRAGIVRACAHRGRILIADEPTSSLDEKNARIAKEILLEDNKERLLLMITHDMSLLRRFDRIVCMDNLEPVFVGTYEEYMMQR